MFTRRFALFVAAAAAAALTGCGGGLVPEAGKEVEVTGKVSPPAGKSVAGFSIFFQPTGGKAQPIGFPIQPDGTFSGKMMSGKYTYSLAAGKGAATEKALEAFPESYRQGSLDRQVDVNGGEIQLKF